MKYPKQAGRLGFIAMSAHNTAANLRPDNIKSSVMLSDSYTNLLSFLVSCRVGWNGLSCILCVSKNSNVHPQIKAGWKHWFHFFHFLTQVLICHGRVNKITIPIILNVTCGILEEFLWVTICTIYQSDEICRENSHHIFRGNNYHRKSLFDKVSSGH